VKGSKSVGVAGVNFNPKQFRCGGRPGVGADHLTSRKSIFENSQGDHGRVDQKFSGMFEIDRDAIADGRLDLSIAPFRPAWMANPLARFDRGSGAE